MLQDLVAVLRHIKTIYEAYTLGDLYGSLAGTITDISTNSTPELQQARKDYITRIEEAHAKLEPDGWSKTAKKVFTNFGATSIVGAIGLAKFKKSFVDNAANLPGLIAELNAQKESLQKLYSDATGILSSLGGLAKEPEIPVGKEIVEIVFDKDVAINNFVDLEKQSKLWNRLIRALSQLADVPAEETVIVSAGKDNPFEFIVVTLPVLAKALRYTSDQLLGIWKDVVEAQKLMLDFEERKFDFGVKKYNFLKSVTDNEALRVTALLEDVGDKFHKPNLAATKLNPAKTELTFAGRDLYKWITSGGKLDYPKPRTNTFAGHGELTLEKVYAETQKLQEDVKILLEERNPRTVPTPKLTKPTRKKRTQSRKQVEVVTSAPDDKPKTSE